jgi:nitroreductase
MNKNPKVITDLKWRYATKKFDKDFQLTQDQVKVLVEAFNLTATSYGLQPVKLIVVSDQALQDAMVDHCFGQRQPADASHVLVLCTSHVDTDYVKAYFKMVQSIRGTAEGILKPFEEFLTDSFSKKTVDEIEAWARNQAYLIMGNLLTVCAAQRIDSCPMEGFEPAGIDKLLKLDKVKLKSALLLPVGRRADDDFMAAEKKVRQPIDKMVRYMD